MSIEHADFDGIERLGAVLGGEIVSTFDQPELVTLGGKILLCHVCSAAFVSKTVPLLADLQSAS